MLFRSQTFDGLAKTLEVERKLSLQSCMAREKSIIGLRYVLVAERHKDGWPHYHALVHERGPMVTKRELQGQWKLGFTAFKLVDMSDKAVPYYVTKYLSKQALARIRASLKYGSGLNAITPDTPSQVWPPCDRIDPKTTTVLDCPF